MHLNSTTWLRTSKRSNDLGLFLRSSSRDSETFPSVTFSECHELLDSSVGFLKAGGICGRGSLWYIGLLDPTVTYNEFAILFSWPEPRAWITWYLSVKLQELRIKEGQYCCFCCGSDAVSAYIVPRTFNSVLPWEVAYFGSLLRWRPFPLTPFKWEPNTFFKQREHKK